MGNAENLRVEALEGFMNRCKGKLNGETLFDNCFQSYNNLLLLFDKSLRVTTFHASLTQCQPLAENKEAVGSTKRSYYHSGMKCRCNVGTWFWSHKGEKHHVYFILFFIFKLVACERFIGFFYWLNQNIW